MKIDARSDKVALHYTGNDAGEPAVSGVPARDLTQNDIARIVAVDHGELKGAARQSAIDATVTRLTAGPYRVTAPKAPAAPAKSKTPASAPRPTAVPPAAPAQPSADHSTEEARP